MEGKGEGRSEGNEGEGGRWGECGDRVSVEEK
jgi:hypothetical protein